MDRIVFMGIVFVFACGLLLLRSAMWQGWLGWRLRGREAFLLRARTRGQRFSARFVMGLPPVVAIKSMLRQNKAQKVDREVFESIIFLRNLVAIEEGRQTSTDYILQRLAEHDGLLKKPYVRMLSLLRMNKKQEALEAFASETGTDAGKDFARLLIRWDEINPRQLMEILISHEKNIKELRITYLKRKDEIISDLIYLPVVLNVFIIFINFIYVGYFINQRELLEMFV